MILARLVISCMMFFFPIASHALGSLTGTYVADSRPRELLFLALTQSGNRLSGSLTITTADGSGGTKAQTQDLIGSSDGGSIDLKSDFFHINGTKKGSTLLLSKSNSAGYRITLRFIAMDEDEFNRILTDWRKSLAAIHDKTTKEAAVQALDRDRIAALSRELSSDINGIRRTGIPNDLSDIEHALNDQRIAIQRMQKDMMTLKNDAAAIPMTCYQAYQTVGYDYNQTLGYDFQQTLGYSISAYRNAKDRLEKRLANVPSTVDKTMKNIAALQQALRASNVQLNASDIGPDDAKEQISKYQVLASDAQSRLPTLQTETNQLVEEAKALMREGKDIVQKVQSSVVCK